MSRIGQQALIACAVSMLAVTTPSRAQLAVVDLPALANIIQEVQSTQQVLANARNQLLQAQQALQTMTGNRGMQLLLSNVVRNYLPTSWAPINGVPQGLYGSYPALAASALVLVSGNAVLSPQTLGALSPADQQRITTARNSAAMNQALSRDAISNTSGRFADLQSLISTIGSANDQKGILELQARIGAEQGMLQNEQTKMQSLYQALQADAAAAREQLQEQVIASHGQFASRFQPTP
jgi:type IV secretion system protein VirB5